MTRAEALEYVRSCDEDEGPETETDARDLYRAIYGSEADSDDQLMIWSLCCAHPDVEPEVSR